MVIVSNFIVLHTKWWCDYIPAQSRASQKNNICKSVLPEFIATDGHITSDNPCLTKTNKIGVMSVWSVIIRLVIVEKLTRLTQVEEQTSILDANTPTVVRGRTTENRDQLS